MIWLGVFLEETDHAMYFAKRIYLKTCDWAPNIDYIIIYAKQGNTDLNQSNLNFEEIT